ncbi:MAG: hypothetical protein HOP15_09685 [Planctomycetes bacterium]|nr:hypothetical protein [Planctomycetota bacterium]
MITLFLDATSSLAQEEGSRVAVELIIVPAITALAGAIGVVAGGCIALYGQRVERMERRRIRLLEAYEDWIVASDRLAQMETKAFLLWMQGEETHPQDPIQQDLGDQMKVTWDAALAAENSEGGARAKILGMDWGSNEVGLIGKVAEIKLNVLVQKEIAEGKLPQQRKAAQGRFFELEREQAELRTQVIAGVHRRIGSKLTH